MFCISRIAFRRFTFHWYLHGSNYNIKKMHAVSTNQTADILHYNDNIKYYHWYSQKSFQRITERLRITKSRKIKQVPTVFNFHEWQYNTEYLQVLVVHRRFCQLETNSPVIASLYIWQTKNKCTYHVPYLP